MYILLIGDTLIGCLADIKCQKRPDGEANSTLTAYGRRLDRILFNENHSHFVHI